MTGVRAPLAAAARWAAGRAPRGGAVVLGYHDVVAGPEAPLELDVTVDQLRRQLLVLRRLGFTVVPLADLAARHRAGEPLDGLAAVTFDDALAGVARHALPVLADLEVPATLFAVTTGWGTRPPWWPGAGPTMTREELLACRDAGLAVGAHTRTHPSLPTLDADALRREVAGSRADLEDLLGTEVDQLAYPFGHHDPAVREQAAAAGYRAAYSFLNGRVGATDDAFRLPRMTMGRHHDRWRWRYHLARPSATWPDHQLDRVVGPAAL